MSKIKKNTYCKLCGNEIDNKTRKCSGCGKQYFHLSKRVYIIALVSIIAVGLIGANLYQYIENNQTIELLNKNLDSMSDNRDEFMAKNDALSSELFSKERELAFWDKSAVIVTESGKKYHHYGCYHLNGCSSIWIYNIEAAKSRGYTPCLDCCLCDS